LKPEKPIVVEQGGPLGYMPQLDALRAFAVGPVLADERSEAPVVRVTSVGDGATIPPSEEPSSSTLAQAGIAEQTLNHEMVRVGTSIQWFEKVRS
jgi:hypothetical protein